MWPIQFKFILMNWKFFRKFCTTLIQTNSKKPPSKIDSVWVSFFLSQAPVSLWERSVLTSATPVFVPVCLCVNSSKGRDTKTPGTPNKWTEWRAHLPALKGQSSVRICLLTSTLPESHFVLHLRPYWPENEERGTDPGSLTIKQLPDQETTSKLNAIICLFQT